MSLSIFFAICSAITFAVTEVIKPLTRVLFKNRDLRTFIVRICACIIGAIAGFQLADSLLGMWLGFASGILNSLVIAYIQLRFSATTPTSQENKKEE